MIIVASPSKPFAYNPKGAPKRAVILNAYSAEIDALYDAVEKGIPVVSPNEWTHATSLAFVREIVNGVLRHPAKDFEDIFECGCDRLVTLLFFQCSLPNSFLKSTGDVDKTKPYSSTLNKPLFNVTIERSLSASHYLPP